MSRMEPVFQNSEIINGTAYFASDFHLGSPDRAMSEEREQRILQWLDLISCDVTHLFLLGDIFDFWFEYKDVVPRGHFHLFSALSRLREKKVEIFYFTGNHDMWVKSYFTEEIGMKLFRKQKPFLINGKRCLVGHGDGLGPKDHGYKLIKKLFAFRPNIKLYGALHPRIAFAMASFFSRKSRAMITAEEEVYQGDEKEMLVQYANSVLQHEQIDYFIYGHRHLPIEKQLNNHAVYLNTGDWLMHDTYIRFDHLGPVLQTFQLT